MKALSQQQARAVVGGDVLPKAPADVILKAQDVIL